MINKYSLSLLVLLGALTFSFAQIYSEDFTGQNGKGAIGPGPSIDVSGVSWSIDVSSSSLSASTDWFNVQNEVFEARDVDGNSFWFSPSIDISAYTNVNFQLSASESGTMEAGDLIQTTYRINGGIWTQASSNGFLNDDFTSALVSETGLSGNTLELRVRINNGAGDEYHRIDNVLVNGTSVSSCTISDSGNTFVNCNVGPSNDGSDDYITFDLDPSGSNLGVSNTYSVSVTMGSATIVSPVSTTGLSYGTPVNFQLNNGSAGGGNIEITITDDDDASCTEVISITDPGNCSGSSGCNIEDDFDRANSTTIGNGWTEVGGDAEINGNELHLTVNGFAGRDYIWQDISSAYNSTLSNLTNPITWEFNMRHTRGDPSGFGSGNYGSAFILAGSNSDLTQGNGYAVVHGNSGTTDNIRLVRYTNGIDANGNLTNIISGSSDYGNQHLSIRVTYNPLNNEWELFVRNDGSTFNNPNTLGGSDSEGTATNNTYVGNSLDYVAAFWNHNNSSSERAEFDNICISTSTVAAPEIQLVDDNGDDQACDFAIDYGVIANSTNSDISFEIRNEGTDVLTINSITGLNAPFTLVSSIPTTIAVGASATITVRFSPTSDGVFNDTLIINSDDLNESICNINLTGEGFTAAPEIDVERNTFATIPNNSAADNGFNTVFAQLPVGDMTEIANYKTYYISNEGTDDLEINSISLDVGTNFDLIGLPSSYPVTILPGERISFQARFSPVNPPGTKTDWVNITNNDTSGNENPYRFQIQGLALCAGTTLTATPESGPTGTVVTIMGSNFDDTITSATIGGSASNIVTSFISTTEIEVTIPNNAISSNITVSDQSGCISSISFTVIDNDGSNCEGGNAIPTDLFISEITDDDSSNSGWSYIELYNGTGSTVDLENYSIGIQQNGNSTPQSGRFIDLPADDLLNGEVYVVLFGGDDLSNDPAPGTSYDHLYDVLASGINDRDHIRLYNNGGTPGYLNASDDTLVDYWGETNGSNFTVGTGTAFGSSTPNGSWYTYRRLNTVVAPDNTTQSPWTTTDGLDWQGLIEANYTNVGQYSYPTGDLPTISAPSVSYTGCNEVEIEVIATENFAGANSLNVQWYYFDPNDSTLPEWKQVTNGGVFSGATNQTLIISDTSGILDYQFYCRARDNDDSCFQASNAVSLNPPRATWDGTHWNWNDGTPQDTLPDSAVLAVLNADYDTAASAVETSFSCCNLEINNATLTIQNNTYVEAINTLNVNGAAGSVLIAPQGAFVQRNGDETFVDADNPDLLQVTKTTAPMDIATEYTYWSSPVRNPRVEDALEDANPGRRYRFFAQDYRDSREEIANSNSSNDGQHDDLDDNGLDDYVNDGTNRDWQLVTGTDTMIAGVGYASTHSPGVFNSSPCSTLPDPNCQFNYTFNGAFNNGEILVPIYRNDEEMGDNNWNFVGNPYPSAISADIFLNTNTYNSSSNPNGVMTGAIYLWSQNTPANENTGGFENQNFSASDYAVINGLGYTDPSDPGGDSSDPSNRMIPSGQGFFIAMSDNVVANFHSDPTSQTGDIRTANLIFNNVMRVRGAGNNSQFFRSSNDVSNNKDIENVERLWLNLKTDNGASSQILIGYKEGATDGLDIAYFDAQRNLATGAYMTMYSILPETDKVFVIQGKRPESLNLEEIIPLGFSTSIDEATLYTLSIDKLEGTFLTSNAIYVKDYLLGVTHNLTNSDYSFTSDVGEFNDRFEIVFQEDSLSLSENELDANGLTIIELQDGKVQFSVPSNFEFSNIEIIDLLGRTVYRFNTNNSHTTIHNLDALSNSAYIARVVLTNGQVLTQKAIKRK